MINFMKKNKKNELVAISIVSMLILLSACGAAKKNDTIKNESSAATAETGAAESAGYEKFDKNLIIGDAGDIDLKSILVPATTSKIDSTEKKK